MESSESDSDFEKLRETVAEENLENNEENIEKENIELLRRVNQFLKENSLTFNGFKDLEGNEIVDDQDESIDQTPESVKKELAEAIAQGDINKLDDLLRLPNVDINTKFYSENLLMIAIKNKQEKIAEYLIANGIDFTYEVKFYEIEEENENKSPLISCFFSSARQMAYEREMMKIVDLIDIFNKKTDKHIKNILAKRFLKENVINKNNKKLNKSFFNQNGLIDPDKDNFNREEITDYLLSDEANLLQLKHQQEEENEILEETRKQSNALLGKNQKKLLKANDSQDADVNKEQDDDDDENITITESSLSYISNETINKSGYFPNRKYRKVDNIGKQVMDQIEDKTLNQNFFEIENDLFKKKSFQYQGYKINFYVTSTNLPSPTQDSLLDDFYNKIYISNRGKLSHYSKQDTSSNFNGSPLLNKNSSRSSHKRLQSSRTDTNRSSLNFTPSVIPESVLSFRSEEKFFEKKIDKTITPILSNSKEMKKIKNHNYLNELRKRSSFKDIIDDNLKNYTEPLFPFNSQSFDLKNNESKTKNSKNMKKTDKIETEFENDFSIKNIQNNNLNSDSKKVSFKLDLNEVSKINQLDSKYLNRSLTSLSLTSSWPSTKNKQPKDEHTQKTKNQIFDSYITSLKKSGLINKNCLPLIKKKSKIKSNPNHKTFNDLIQTK